MEGGFVDYVQLSLILDSQCEVSGNIAEVLG
jgi:hypothetical protein